jgi:4-alpha-glucanotransferase
MTDVDPALRRLAALAGVAETYHDAWGKLRHVAPETLRAVLAAMGLAVASAADIAASAAALEAEEWRRLLPPVVVVEEGDAAASVPLTLSAGSIASHVDWSLRREDGSARQGAVALNELSEWAQAGAPARRRLALPIDADQPLGYHRLNVAVGRESAETVLIVAPRRCYLPPAFANDCGAWGLTAQLYGLRSARNGGIGDFTDLGALAEIAGERGARVLGVNPLHALFPAEPRHASPYSPSSRLFLNPLYIDIEAVPDFRDGASAQERVTASDFRAALARARAEELVDYLAVADLKRPVFRDLFRSFAERHLGDGPEEAKSGRGAAFRQFQRDGGATLRSYAVFNALHERHYRESGIFDWREWPVPLRDAGSDEIRRFAAANRDEVELHQYLAWEADRQLGAAAARAASAGVALYRDLAVGVDRNGASAWADPSRLASDASLGAPPDALNMKGQNWGLAPFNPVALRREAYAPFVAALRANMRHAGVLRIDHVMALKHLYWVPRGAGPEAGAYVSYPFEDLLRVLALESVRQRCAVIGEDLGTVPTGFRETLGAAGVLSYRVLLFERDASGAFLPPRNYPPLAAATSSTHDLATLKGFWLGRDLAWRRALDLYPTPEAREEDRRSRDEDRRLLLAALVGEGVLSAEAALRLLSKDGAPHYDPRLAEAVNRYLGRSAACLVLMQMEDALGELEEANLPGTVDEHPNWRRKLTLALEALRRDPDFLRLSAAIDAERKGKGAPS